MTVTEYRLGRSRTALENQGRGVIVRASSPRGSAFCRVGRPLDGGGGNPPNSVQPRNCRMCLPGNLWPLGDSGERKTVGRRGAISAVDCLQRRECFLSGQGRFLVLSLRPDWRAGPSDRIPVNVVGQRERSGVGATGRRNRGAGGDREVYDPPPVLRSPFAARGLREQLCTLSAPGVKWCGPGQGLVGAWRTMMALSRKPLTGVNRKLVCAEVNEKAAVI